MQHPNRPAQRTSLDWHRLPRRALLAGSLLPALSLLVAPVAARARQADAEPTAAATSMPNLFELHDEHTQTTISYATSSIGGRPQFSYRDPHLQRSFQGAEIRTAHSEIGTLVTVTLQNVPDLQTVTVTLLVPEINLQQAQSDFRTTAIFTTHRTSIGGPALVKGAVEVYRTISLQGTARAVLF